MILVVGALANPAIAFVCSRLFAASEDFLLLDTRQYPIRFEPQWSIVGGNLHGNVRAGRRMVPLAAISAVYIHQIDGPPWLPYPDVEPDPGVLPQGAWALAAFVSALPCLVVNDPSACRTNAAKALQLPIIARAGFRTPRTLITNAPGEVRRFHDEVGGRVVFKSMSHRRSIVRLLSDEDLPRLDRLALAPVLFQEQVNGIDIRVHVVGDNVFATSIQSDATDYRHGFFEGVGPPLLDSILLPDQIATQCVTLTRELGMAISGIDLRRTPEGEYVCFEVNPAPGFAFYQSATNQPIGEALIDLLRQASRTFQ
jgi:glutathione synthase/RimK-type ligase-like ATP-grasp enzyme